MIKGIILAGGTGSRLFPVTKGAGKQLLPIYNKPMIYYPLTTLMHAGVRHFLVITTPHERAAFSRLLGDGSRWGISIEYAEQPAPEGIAQAFLIGESFLDGDGCALILGDNLFYGQRFFESLEQAHGKGGATVFACRVEQPEQYGVVELGSTGRAVSLEEKPVIPKSNLAVTGLYFYDTDAVSLAKTLTPSHRGELEITDLNRLYMEKGELHVVEMGSGLAWLDTGSPGAMLNASNFIETIEVRHKTLIGSPEETAYRLGLIDAGQLKKLAAELSSSNYGRYLMSIV